ncbi:MAG: MFS transporter, partial [Comamonadaceae bacterium]
MVTSEGLADVSPAVLTARLDRIPTLTRKHIGLVALLISLFVFDIVDLSALSFVAPALREQWGLTLEELGLLTSTAFIGMFLGGLIGGRLADRFGRKPILLVGVVLFSLASIASAFAPNAEVLGVLRFILGFGLQMTTGAVLVIVSESFPKAFRGRVMASVWPAVVALLGGSALAIVGLVPWAALQ